MIATGRSLHSALAVQKELKLDFPGSYILASNGCLIYDCDARETMFRTGVPLPLTAEIFKMAEKHGIYVQTYTAQYFFCISIGSYYLVIEFPFSVSYFQVEKVDKNDIKFSK